MPWINADGLPVLFGIEEAAERDIGEFGNLDSQRWVEIKLKAGELPLIADNSQIMDRTYKIPAGALVTRVEFSKPTTTWAGASGTLDFGLTNPTGTDPATADPNFLVEAITITELNIGGVDVAGWVGAWSTTDAKVPFPVAQYITAEVNTTQFTAGESTVYVFWYVPNIDDDTLVYTKP